MSAGPLDPQLQELLECAVDSLEKVELVLHLSRAPGPVPLHALCAVGVSAETAACALDELERADVVVAESGRWAIARTGRWVEHVAELVEATADDRTDVFRELSSRAVARVRAEAALVFAEAFVVRPKRGQ